MAMMGRGAGYIRDAAFRMGAMGKKSAADVAAHGSPLTGMGPSRAQGEAGARIQARGNKRLRNTGLGVSGMMVLNASRSPSSGTDGMMPQSSGGATGY